MRAHALASGGEHMERLSVWLNAWAPRILSIVRIMVGLLYFEHGTQKIFQWPYNPYVTGIHPWTLNWFAGMLETVGSPFMVFGLFTRPVALLFSGEMAIGYFLRFAPHGFFPATNGGEVLILFSFVYLYFAFAGGGRWSLDAALVRGWSKPALAERA
jgi:putative oxidoreductase